MKVRELSVDFLVKVRAGDSEEQLSIEEWVSRGGFPVFRPRRTVLPLGKPGSLPHDSQSWAHSLVLLICFPPSKPLLFFGLSGGSTPPAEVRAGLGRVFGLFLFFFFFKARMVWF